MNYQAAFNSAKIAKASGLPSGTVKTWFDGKKYEKQVTGTWKAILETKESVKVLNTSKS